MKTKRWHLRSAGINEFVDAFDQWEAWDSLRDRPIEDFGFVVGAEANESGDDESFPVRASILLFRWGRDADAEAFIAMGIDEGMQDTTQHDRAAAKGGRT